MSRSLRKVKDSVISSINQIFKDREYPKLPIDDSPIQGDLSIICFPGAQPLKKSPEAVANEASAPAVTSILTQASTPRVME